MKAGVFEPEVLDTLSQAYDDIMPIVTEPSGPYAEIDTEELQQMVADAILGAARRGMLDLDRLEGAALKRLAEDADASH